LILGTFSEKQNRIAREKETVEVMIRLYCRHAEGNRGAEVRGELCPACRELRDHAFARLDHCRYGEAKPACRHCPAHCYKPAMREHIRRVMRFSGPRMLLYAPLAAIRHLFSHKR